MDELQSFVYIPMHDVHETRFSWRKLLAFVGPGALMSIAYIDPGNLESDLQVGAKAGYVLLWLLPWSIVCGYIIQMQAAKLGVATGKDLAAHCQKEFPAVPRYALWLMAEVAIVGADIQEVIGSAIALALLSRGAVPLWGGVLLTGVTSFLLLFIERLGVRKLEAFFAAMIAVMAGSFAVMYARADVPTAQVAEGLLLPRLPGAVLPEAVALFGSLIMPHNIYLHSALVRSRQLAGDTSAHKWEAIKYFGYESGLALLAAVFINVFVVSVFAAGFYGTAAADAVGLQNAGQYLGDTYGSMATYIWALGLLAAGQSSTMTGCYCGQFVMNGYLNLKVSPLARIVATRLVSMVPTLAIALAYSDGPGLDALNQWLNLLQSVQLPFALVPLLALNASYRVMGRDFVNPRWLNAISWLIAAAVMAINFGAASAFAAMLPDGAGYRAAFGFVVALYLGFVGYLFGHALRQLAGGGAAGDAAGEGNGQDGADSGSAEAGCCEAREPLLLPSERLQPAGQEDAAVKL